MTGLIATLIKEKIMNLLWWAVITFVIAVIAGILGFGGIAVAAAMIGKVLFFIFIVAALVFLVLGLTRRKRLHIHKPH